MQQPLSKAGSIFARMDFARHRLSQQHQPMSTLSRFACVLAATCWTLSATEPPVPAPLPLDPLLVDSVPAAPARIESLSRGVCLRLALTRNRGLRAAIADLQRSRFIIDATRSELYTPTVSGSYTAANGADAAQTRVDATAHVLGTEIKPYAQSAWTQDVYEEGFDPYRSGFGVAISRRWLGLAESIRLRQPLTTAEVGFLITANNLVLNRKQLEADAVRAFLAVQRAEARVRLREKRVDSSRETLKVLRANIANQLKAPIEEYNSLIELSQAEADLIGEKASLSGAIERLCVLLAMPVTTPVGIAAEDLAAQAVNVPDVEQDVRAAITGSERLGIRHLELRLQRDQLAVLRDRTWPTVTTGVDVGRWYEGPSPSRRADGYEYEDRAALTVSMTLPLDFYWGARARWHALERDIMQKNLQLDEQTALTEQSVRDTHRRIVRLIDTARLATQRVEAERRRLEATQIRYDAGSIDNLELTRQRQSLDTAELSLLDARIELQTATADYAALLPAPRGADAEAAKGLAE